MAAWAKIKFFWNTMLGSTGSTLTASATESSGDYDVSYIHNWLETNFWKSDSDYIHTIIYDGPPKGADFLCILGHNLNEQSITVRLQYSATGAWAGEEGDAFTGEIPSADTIYLKEFANPGTYPCWRLRLSSTSQTVKTMAIAVWGERTELKYASASFDPHGQEVKANVNVSQGG